MFTVDNTDLTSPIFNRNNKEIGYAFKYAQNINDYSPYMINNATVSKRPLSNDVKEGLSEVCDSNNKVQPEALPPELQSRNNKKTSIKKTQERRPDLLDK